MAAILSSLRNTVIAGVVVLIIMVAILMNVHGDSIGLDASFIMRWLHVLCGVMWIGILWYFNFVQIPTMPSIPDELKPAIGKHIAPEALFWFRWGAMGTIITGLILSHLSGYLVEALSFSGSPKEIAIGIGMWMGIIMWFNVWFIIWPAQKKALGIVDAEPDVKAASARTAMLFSRTNTLLSIPMLYAMVSAQNIYQ